VGIAREQMVSASPKRGARGVLARSLTITEYLHRPCLPAPVQVALAAAILRRGGGSTGFHILGYPKPTEASRARFRSRTLHGRSAAPLALQNCSSARRIRPLRPHPPPVAIGGSHTIFSQLLTKGSTDD